LDKAHVMRGQLPPGQSCIACNKIMQPFSHYTSQYRQNIFRGYPYLTPSFEWNPFTQGHEIWSR